MTENNNMENCLDWGDAIENDGQEFILLPEGDYVFTVADFERGRFPGSAKIPPCNKASLVLQVKTPEGIARIHTDLILYRSLEWKLSSFFRCIGQKEKGRRLVMDWTRVPGARGRAHIRQRSYTAGDGTLRTVNDVERFLDYDEAKMPEADAPEFTELGGDESELPF